MEEAQIPGRPGEELLLRSKGEIKVEEGSRRTNTKGENIQIKDQFQPILSEKGHPRRPKEAHTSTGEDNSGSGRLSVEDNLTENLQTHTEGQNSSKNIIQNKETGAKCSNIVS